MSIQESNEGIIQSGGSINAEQIAVGRFASVSGNVTKTINHLKSNSSSEAANLADLLEKLKASVDVDHQLSKTDKAELLEQIQVIAEAGNNPNSEESRKTVKTAGRTLKGILTELPHATAFIEACSSLLPIILKIFGL